MKIEIGGKTFTLKRGSYTPQSRYHSLTDAYDKPSSTKIAIWYEWKAWYLENSESDYDYMSICSRNAQVFSINGRITVNGIEYTYLITRTRQELYR